MVAFKRRTMFELMKELRQFKKDKGYKKFEFINENAVLLAEAMEYVYVTCDKYDKLPTDELLSITLGVGDKKLISRHRGSETYKAEDDLIIELLLEYKTICGEYLVQGSIDGCYRERVSMFLLQANHGYKIDTQIDLNHLNNQKVEILNDWED